MAKQMYNAREAATGDKVKEVQDFYKKVHPAINRYESKVYYEEQKNKKPVTLKDKLISYAVFFGVLAFIAGWIYLFVLAIQNISDPILLGITILGLAIGIPVILISLFVSYLSKPSKTKPVHVKFPLRKQEEQFRKLISELGEELGAGSKLDIFIDTRQSRISFHKTLPEHIMFRGKNDDPSKRSFLFEIIDDEITVLLPDTSGVYKYDKKPKYDTSGIPDGNMPRYAAEGTAITGDILF